MLLIPNGLGASMMASNGTAAAIAQYRAVGYGVLRGVFGAAEIAAMAETLDRHWARGIALGASYRHGNLLYRVGTDGNLGRVVRMVQWAAYEDGQIGRAHV